MDWLEQLLSKELGRPPSAVADLTTTGEVPQTNDTVIGTDATVTVVCGLLSAAVPRTAENVVETVRTLFGLKPVGRAKEAFALAPTFGAALVSLLEDASLLESVVRIAITDIGGGHAADIYFLVKGDVRSTQYVPMNIAMSLFRQGRERNFSRYELCNSSIVRETAILPPLLWAIFDKLARG